MVWWPYVLGLLGIFTVVTMWAVVVTEGCRKIKLQYYGFKLASAARYSDFFFFFFLEKIFSITIRFLLTVSSFIGMNETDSFVFFGPFNFIPSAIHAFITCLSVQCILDWLCFNECMDFVLCLSSYPIFRLSLLVHYLLCDPLFILVSFQRRLTDH